MFGNSITMTLGGSGGTAKVLSLINQDSYSGEYYLRETLQDFRLKIRHTTEKAKSDGSVLDRHNVEFTQTVFATPSSSALVRQFYFVFRNQTGDDAALAVDVAEAVAYWANATNLPKLVGWES